MVEIFTEFSGGDFGLDVAPGRRDNPYIDLHLVAAAHALKCLLNQHAQDLVLRFPRHVGNLVDEERTPMRFFKRADFAPSPVHRLLGPEQLELHALRHHGRRIDDDEGSVGARRMRVNGARRQLLARARWADNEDSAVRW